jgi:hypothetical protein
VRVEIIERNKQHVPLRAALKGQERWEPGAELEQLSSVDIPAHCHFSADQIGES